MVEMSEPIHQNDVYERVDSLLSDISDEDKWKIVMNARDRGILADALGQCSVYSVAGVTVETVDDKDMPQLERIN